MEGDVPKGILKTQEKIGLINLDYELLDIEKYISKVSRASGKELRQLPVMTSRNCPHNCVFCYVQDRTYRFQDPKESIEELKRLKRRYGIKSIKFAEDNFFVNKNRVEELCKMMIKENLNFEWATECRADYFDRYDDEFLKLITKAGCKRLGIGVEFGSQRMLDFVKKDITIKQILNSAKLCNEYKIYPHYSFIMGMPEEEKEDMMMTVKLIEEIYKICPIAIGGINLFRPYPPLFKKAFEAANLKEPESLEEWTNPEYINIMTTENPLLWSKHNTLAKNIAFYSQFYFFNWDRFMIYYRKSKVMALCLSLMIIATRIRWKLRFFGLPIEKYISKYVSKVMKG